MAQSGSKIRLMAAFEHHLPVADHKAVADQEPGHRMVPVQAPAILFENRVAGDCRPVAEQHFEREPLLGACRCNLGEHEARPDQMP